VRGDGHADADLDEQQDYEDQRQARGQPFGGERHEPTSIDKGGRAAPIVVEVRSIRPP
jgi:hypothetical protein